MARLPDDQIAERMKSVPGWALKQNQLEKAYTFDDFKGSMAFVNRVAAIADDMDHHPDILILYNRVTLSLTSHDSGGLTERDFSLAGRIDQQ
jgi:4a-hydroxytetrahydrobiopterin dehydratase